MNATSTHTVYVCMVCGSVYDPQQGWPEHGIAPGTAWDDIADDWRCPDCNVGKKDFSPMSD